MVEKIDSITPESLQRVAKRTFGNLGSFPTVVAVGSHDIGEQEVFAQLRKYGVGRTTL